MNEVTGINCPSCNDVFLVEEGDDGEFEITCECCNNVICFEIIDGEIKNERIK